MSSTNDTNQNKKTPYYPCNHIYSHITFTQITSMNLKHFPFVIIWADIYMHAPFSTSLDTLLRSSKAEKLLNLICPIVLLFTSFALPSTDKFAEKNVQLPRHLPFYLLYFSSPYFGKTFFGERKKPGVLNIVLIIPFTFSYDKNMSLFVALFFSRLSFPLFLSFPLTILTYLSIITYSYT